MTKKGNGHDVHTTALTSAAAALDAELRRYAELASEVLHVPLTSEKSIDRAGRAVLEAVECEKRVMENVKALVHAVTAARELQERTSSSLGEQATTIAQRRTELDALLARFNALGEATKTLSEKARTVAAYKPSPYGAEAADGAGEVREALQQIDVGMAACAEHAEALAKDATARDLVDLGRQADGLRQQILSARNRLSHLNKSLAS